MKIIIDHRERNSNIIEMIKKTEIDIEIKTLPVGDYIVSNRIGIERKTISDFESSLISGRLFDQIQRLNKAYEFPIVLLEGNVEEFKLNIKQIGRINSKKTEKIKNYLEHVPDAFQKLVNNKGYSFNIYEGGFTNLSELVFLKGKKVPLINAKWDNMNGITTKKGVYINPNKIKSRTSVNVPLHETGHAIDFTLGKLWGFPKGKISNSKEYKKVFEECKESIGEGKRQKKLKEELFAEGFARHYDGWNSRYAQKDKCPGHYDFFNQLEEKIVFGR